MFWPDASDKKAAHSLSQGLLHLQKALGERDSSTHAYALGRVSLFYLHEGYCFRAVQLMQEVTQAARQAGDHYLETRYLYHMAFALPRGLRAAVEH